MPRSSSRPAADDLAHPAFGKLFVETEYLRRQRRPALPPAPARRDGCRRHGRSMLLSLEGRPQGPVEWETDRARFLGRGREPRGSDGARRTRAVRHDRRRARSDCQPSPADPRFSRRDGAALFRDRHGLGPRDRRGARAEVPRSERRSRARSPSPSRTRRAACGTSAFRADEAVLFERLASRVLGTDGSLRAHARPRSPRTSSARRVCGRTPSPAISRSCSSASSATTMCRWCGRCCRRRSTGASRV